MDGLDFKATGENAFSHYINAPSVPKLSPPVASTSSLSLPDPPSIMTPPILELHGTLRHVHCLGECQKVVGRDAFQDKLSTLNPTWAEYADEVSLGTRENRENPDGDIELGDVKYEDFIVPQCENCGGDMKPVRHHLVQLLID